MKRLLIIWVILLLSFSSTFWYSLTTEDKALLDNIYTKLDTIFEASPKKIEDLYLKISEVKESVKNKERIYYLLTELEDYSYEKLISQEGIEFLVEEVVDGDTVKVSYLWKKTSIRLIGIDAPESYALRYGYVECYWSETKEHLKNFIEWKKITLEYDESQGYKDDYGRLLAYIVHNWENINQKLVMDWYAWEFTYDEPYIYQTEFQEAQNIAETSNIWLWNSNTCNGERINISSDSSDENIEDSADQENKENTWDEEVYREYISWPKWGCYYWNEFDNKTYVGRGFCK